MTIHDQEIETKLLNILENVSFKLRYLGLVEFTAI